MTVILNECKEQRRRILDEAPGILENTGVCVWYLTGVLRDELAGTISLTADASATNPQAFDRDITCVVKIKRLEMKALNVKCVHVGADEFAGICGAHGCVVLVAAQL